MRWILLACLALLLALFLWPQPAESQQPALTATWQGNTLVVIASPGSLYLVGGNLQEQYIGRELVTLPASGVDQQYTPVGREWLELRNANSQTVVRLAVPERPPELWVVILPIVVKT